MRHPRLAVPFLLTAACGLIAPACSPAADDAPLEPAPAADPSVEPARYGPGETAVEPETVRVCLPLEAPCDADPDACCPGTFCTSALSPYLPPECAAPRADGEFCLEGVHCRGGHCVNGRCRSAACADLGTPCSGGFACCDGLVCDLAGYTMDTCVEPFEDGRYCIDDIQCESGRCLENVCAPADCRASGAPCYFAPEACCPGTFCHRDITSYGQAHCTPPLPAGEYCLDPEQCASGVCADNACE